MSYNAQDLFHAISTLSFNLTCGDDDDAQTFPVPIGSYPINVIVSNLIYGTRRKLQDPVGKGTLSTSDRVKAMKVTMSRWEKGDVGRAPRESESADPILDRAREIVRKALAKNDKDGWQKFLSDAKDQATRDKVNIKTLIHAKLDSKITDDLRAKAKAQLDAEGEMVEGIDLSL